MYLCLILQTGMLLATSYTIMLIMAAAFGVFKGVRAVYMSLLIPSFIPIERLASASGLQMSVNGMLVLALGPVLGETIQ